MVFIIIRDIVPSHKAIKQSSLSRHKDNTNAKIAYNIILI